MPNVQYVDRSFLLQNEKEDTIRAAISRAEKQFADRSFERGAFGCY